MTFKLPKSEKLAQVKLVSKFTEDLRRQIKIEWEDPGWGTEYGYWGIEYGYMVYKKCSQTSHTERIGGPFTFEEDAKEFVEEYIDGVVAILLGAGELKED